MLLNPATIKDNANFKDSKALSEGIIKVWVNGVCVYNEKKSTNKFPGTFIGR